LKLVRLMQEDVNLRTAELQRSLGAKKPGDEEGRLFAALSEEQGRLAELVLQLLRPAPNPEEGPAPIPDTKPDRRDPLEPQEDLP
jgi:hypothetical protein